MDFNLNGIIYRETIFKNYFVTQNGDIAQIKFDDNGNLKSFFLMRQEINMGYCRVEINHKHYLVHRLVYQAWSGDVLNNELVIDHIDANPRNNSIENLRQVTQKENIANAIFHGNYGHNHNTKIKVFDDITESTTYYDSIKDFLKAINAPEYIIKHGGLSGLNKRIEYNRYHVTKINEH